jgi:hypothetical protein
MAQKQDLELTWIGKENRPKLEPRILLLSGVAQQAGVQGRIFGQLYNPNFKSIEFNRFNILAGRSTTPAAPSRIATAGWSIRSGCCRRATNGLTNRGIDYANPFLKKRLLLLNGGCNEPRTRP